MPQLPTTSSARRTHAALLLAGIVLLLLLYVGKVALKSRVEAGHSAAPAVVALPTVDPRLVLHQRRVALAATLTHGLRLTGVMTPDLPGHNTFDVALRGPGTAHTRGESPVRLAASMPGMAMQPLRAVLVKHGGRFSGALTLPMFGAYQLTVAVVTAAWTATGVLTVTIPLPQVFGTRRSGR